MSTFIYKLKAFVHAWISTLCSTHNENHKVRTTFKMSARKRKKGGMEENSKIEEVVRTEKREDGIKKDFRSGASNGGQSELYKS